MQKRIRRLCAGMLALILIFSKGSSINTVSGSYFGVFTSDNPVIASAAGRESDGADRSSYASQTNNTIDKDTGKAAYSSQSAVTGKNLAGIGRVYAEAPGPGSRAISQGNQPAENRSEEDRSGKGQAGEEGREGEDGGEESTGEDDSEDGHDGEGSSSEDHTGGEVSGGDQNSEDTTGEDNKAEESTGEDSDRGGSEEPAGEENTEDAGEKGDEENISPSEEGDTESKKEEQDSDDEKAPGDAKEENGEDESGMTPDDRSQYENKEVPDNNIDQGAGGIRPRLGAKAVDPHNVTMPDTTARYFRLQKSSTKVSEASGSKLKVVADAKAASKYIFEEYPEGARYNFTPNFTKDTRIITGGGAGGSVSFAVVGNGPQRRYGDLYNSCLDGGIADRIFNLNKCSSAPYATYTNVGTFYDKDSGKTYEADMRLTVTGWVFPGEETRRDLTNQDIDAPYVGFTTGKIGMISHATDSISLQLDFYYAGTTTPIRNLAGYVEGCDIDVMQGIDFGKGFEKVIMFNDGSSHLQYNPSGLTGSSVGYVSTRAVTGFSSNNTSTTALGLFTGSRVSLVFTLAKCDRQDTGGESAYAVAGGFGVPADTTDDVNTCYRNQNSTGMLVFRSDVQLVPIPDSGYKREYPGEIKDKSSTSEKTSLILSEGERTVTYVLSLAAGRILNADKTRYTSFGFEDTLDPFLKVKKIQVFRNNDGGGAADDFEDVTGLFEIKTASSDDHSEKISAAVPEEKLKEVSFYGYTYYLHIQAEIKSEEELTAFGCSIKDRYREAGTEGAGNIRIENKGYVTIVTNMGTGLKKETNKVTTDLQCMLAVRKIDMLSGDPAEGVEFGLFGGEDVPDPKKENAILTAKTNRDGIAVFKTTEKQSVYSEEYGDGPYVIKELSVPDKYKNVWNPSVNKEWAYAVRSLKEEALFGEKTPAVEEIPKEAVLPNKNRTLGKGGVKVRKSSKETGEILSGAEFMLAEWSEKEGAYRDIGPLIEKQEEGDGNEIVYVFEESLINTPDNLGRYRVTEKKAPAGCVLFDRTWLFEVAEDTKDDGSNIVCIKEQKEGENAVPEKQTGILNVENILQKGRLRLLKTDDAGDPVPGVTFTVTAAEDIYAPWSTDEQGKPLKDAEPLVPKGAVVDELITNDEGVAESQKGHELFIGFYHVQEQSGAQDHVMSPEVRDVKMSYGTDPTIPFLLYSLNVNNSKMNPSFSVAKLADRTTDEKGEEVDFDKETGRYTEKKYAGIYRGRGRVDYSIHVTNTGNVALYNILLTDALDQANEDGQALASYAVEGSGRFEIPDSGTVKSVKGKKVALTKKGMSGREIMLSRLESGDSILLHFLLDLKEDAAEANHLPNIVYGSAFYDIHENDKEAKKLKEVPVDGLVDGEGKSLVRDEDEINIPGEGELVPVKTADRTTGIVIKDGEQVSGVKVPGIYYGGETVNYTITVKNTGNAPVKKITVKDTPGSVLREITEADSPGFLLKPDKNAENEQDGQKVSLITNEGIRIDAERISRDEVLLCAGKEEEDGEAAGNVLRPGDYVTLTYRLILKPSVGNRFDLANTVAVNGWYYNGSEDVPTKEKKDRDRIETPGEPEGRVAKLADRTTGAVLRDGRYEDGTKVSGVYVSGDTIRYKITVTNSGKADLYHLILKDEMSKELKKALEESTITFEQKEYTSSAGRKVRAALEEPTVMVLDFLGVGDSVDVILKATVKERIGNLFDLDNVVHLTASYRLGNEEEKEKYDEQASKKWVKLTYHSNYDEDLTGIDSETPCVSGAEISVNGNSFEREGYRFTGWNARADGGGKTYLPDDIYKMPEKDADLYAMWVKDDKEKETPLYRLIYSSANPADQSETDEESPVGEGTSIKINDSRFRWEGYRFTGWNTKPDGSGDSIKPDDIYTMPADDVTLYAQWTKLPVYKLVYDANHGSGEQKTDGESPAVSGTALNADGNPFTYTDKGITYEFVEWNTRPGGEGESFLPGDTVTLYDDMTLYAQWEPVQEDPVKRYILTYHANNNTSASSVDAQTPAQKDEHVEIDENSFRYAGMEFAGWNTRADGSGKDYEPGADYVMPGRDTALYAQWREKKGATLTYHSNTKEAETTTDAETPAEPGEEIRADGVFCSRDGYGFAGWNTQKDGGGTSYKPGDLILLSKDTVLYAQWVKNPTTYKLTYDSNLNGEEHMTEVDGETPCVSETKVTVNPNRFYIPGKVFEGWNTKADGSGDAYGPEDALIMPEKDIILYACWLDEKDQTDLEAGEDGEDSIDILDGLPEGTDISDPASATMKAYEDIREMDTDKAISYGGVFGEIPVTAYMKDNDKVNIPGTPEAAVAKLADRTEGAELDQGRYTGTKIPGVYSGGEKVDFMITVTNTGTADLYEPELYDTFSDELLRVIEKDSVKADSEAVTAKGKKVKIVLNPSKDSKAGGYRLSFDALKAGDSVQIHLTAKIKQGEQTPGDYDNHVKLTALYREFPGNEGLSPIPETDKMQDDDRIDLGSPKLAIAKKADRTKGVILKKGRYQGTKKRGLYYGEDTVSYKLTVTNIGSSTALKLKIEEKPSENLLRYARIKGFTTHNGDKLKTEQGKIAKAESVTRSTLTLDRLEAGDSVTVHYQLLVNKEIVTVTDLDNMAYVYGNDSGGSPIPQTEEMRDNDRINLSEQKALKNTDKEPGPGKSDKTGNTGRIPKTSSGAKTGDDTSFAEYLLLMCIAAVAIALIRFQQRKKKE